MEPATTSGTRWSPFFGVRYDHFSGLLLGVYALENEAVLQGFWKENNNSVRFDDGSLLVVIEMKESCFISAGGMEPGPWTGCAGWNSCSRCQGPLGRGSSGGSALRAFPGLLPPDMPDSTFNAADALRIPAVETIGESDVCGATTTLGRGAITGLTPARPGEAANGGAVGPEQVIPLVPGEQIPVRMAVTIMVFAELEGRVLLEIAVSYDRGLVRSSVGILKGDCS